MILKIIHASRIMSFLVLLQVVIAASVSGYSSVNIDDISMTEDCHKTGNGFLKFTKIVIFFMPI